MLIIIAMIGLIYISLLQFKISQYSNVTPPKHADYLIILGAKVNGTAPSLVLSSRIHYAAKYLKEYPHTVAIASGGKGPGENISEAEAIKTQLVHQGIDESRIIIENRSTDTYENIRYSKKLIPPKSRIGIIVTNNFHLYRAVSIAKDQGLHVYGLPADTPASAILKSYSREYLSITKYYLIKYL
ncbi:YdcF family protein [Neobacillus endophyticus]|uniref:YdcF family protein n=1 Tax=Neobacillus endophyticus TaxID=2738405 RepID=UPI001FE4B99F|nr:YdcF family protein [Neobacillus endophyticus]